MACLFAIMLYNSSWSIDSRYAVMVEASKLTHMLGCTKWIGAIKRFQ